MRIVRPTKTTIELEDADKDFIKKFIDLVEQYADSNAKSFETFLSKNYTISDADIDKLVKLYNI